MDEGCATKQDLFSAAFDPSPPGISVASSLGEFGRRKAMEDPVVMADGAEPPAVHRYPTRNCGNMGFRVVRALKVIKFCCLVYVYGSYWYLKLSLPPQHQQGRFAVLGQMVEGLHEAEERPYSCIGNIR